MKLHATFIGSSGVGRTVYADDPTALACRLADAKARETRYIVEHFASWVGWCVEEGVRRIESDREELARLRRVIAAVRDALPMEDE